MCSEESLRRNWIDFARLILALLVILSHSYALAGLTTEPLAAWTHGQKSFGGLAVDAFFLISGFLIVKSWLYSRGMTDYFHRRILRIYPGFMVALVISVCLAVVASSSASNFLHQLPAKSFAASFLTLSYGALDMPDNSFPGNPYHAVNGSLWTIPLEFNCYIAVAIYGLFALYQYRWLAMAALATVLANYELKVFHHGDPDMNIWGLGCMFVVGSAIFLFRDLVPRSRWLAALCLASLIVGSFKNPWLNAVFPLTASCLVFYCVMRDIHPWLAWTKRADLSYGTYLYAFVVQQSVIYWLHLRQPLLLCLVSMILTLGVAALSWFLVEKPCLALKARAFIDRDPVL